MNAGYMKIIVGMGVFGKKRDIPQYTDLQQERGERNKGNCGDGF